MLKKLQEKIPGAVVVTGKTPNRAEIIQDFTDRKIPCIVNCMVFTEGQIFHLLKLLSWQDLHQIIVCILRW